MQQRAELGEHGSGRGPDRARTARRGRRLGADIDTHKREQTGAKLFRFDPRCKLMSTVDDATAGSWSTARARPRSSCRARRGSSGAMAPSDPSATSERAELVARIDALRIRGPARARRRARRSARRPRAPRRVTTPRADSASSAWSRCSTRPAPEVAEAVARCHAAGIRIIVVTGDHGLTAAAIARRVGIAPGDPTVVTGRELDAHERGASSTSCCASDDELIFARSSPEAKLRIADALRAEGHVVAMTGDGVNDAPALRRADIGVAMGRSGTDVAREASTMVLTDDNFATIVAAVEAGRRVYDNIRKFILYIFAHATPEVVPFLVFALPVARCRFR